MSIYFKNIIYTHLFTIMESQYGYRTLHNIYECQNMAWMRNLH